MDLKFQKDAIDELNMLAKSDRHSILIEGPAGCGKSFIAKQYTKMINVVDFSSVQPTVQSIREALEASYDLTAPVVFCIENLDTGVPAASYTLLKFLEEPSNNVYLIVTCRNRFKVPDTIISRSTCITMSSPIESDIRDYAQIKDIGRFNQLSNHSIWQAVRSLNDVEVAFRLNNDQLAYYTQLRDVLDFKDSVSNIIWKLGHYSDNKETSIPFVFNYIIATTKSEHIKHHAIECMKDITTARIASHAVLAKFVLECKYGD